jgi:hypothetical protein
MLYNYYTLKTQKNVKTKTSQLAKLLRQNNWYYKIIHNIWNYNNMVKLNLFIG